MKILIATHNTAKKKELGEALNIALPTAEFYSLDDLAIKTEPDENGKTFEENAVIKAKFYSIEAGIPAIADDGGLVIDALGGAPGIQSKRWLGRAATDQELIDYTLLQMKDIPKEKRTARFITYLCYCDASQHAQPHTVHASIEGVIAEYPTKKFQPGFPYRAVFKVAKCNKYYDELTAVEHDEVNHRIEAVTLLVKKIRTE